MERTTTLDGRSAVHGVEMGTAPRPLGVDTSAHAPSASVQPAEWLPFAVASLWSLFEAAMIEAERRADSDPIAVTRATNERRYHARGTGRFIGVQLFLPVSDAQYFGGAFIVTSVFPRAMLLLPRGSDDPATWIVAATGVPFGAGLAAALFAGVLYSDCAALSQCERHTGFDLFQTPWS